MSDTIVKYVHEESVHNFKAANEVVPYLISLLNPKSVVDVGCGIGTWLKVFKDNGIEIKGIDGDYVDKKLLKIEVEDFIDFNLEKLYISNYKYDLAISLEVAEHLSIESADVFIDTLTGLSDVVIFSAAIPNQGGQNHINEQEPNYWIQKFKRNGFKLYDILRPVFWDNENVDSWYKQNILIFSNSVDLENKFNLLKSFDGKHLVHPGILKANTDSLEYYKKHFVKINSGKKNIRYYMQLLWKSLRNKF